MSIKSGLSQHQLSSKMFVKKKDHQSDNLLHSAAVVGNLEIWQFIWKQNTDTTTNSCSKSAVHYPVWWSSVKLSFLLEFLSLFILTIIGMFFKTTEKSLKILSTKNQRNENGTSLHNEGMKMEMGLQFWIS